ncbi:hypothetical protein QF117_03310 [Vibrio sp. YMD68]|uniref:hypothetical protein n=1 Tax=Vibrio sp. YMD68 TaxID=3042300 RepID=UPI00249A2D33|nr:hypothetical protein [Vibrio sp. YMD68]WGV97906.1 hypothetical protein QF117_03310 [Vibrio sp. YMD68]
MDQTFYFSYMFLECLDDTAAIFGAAYNFQVQELTNAYYYFEISLLTSTDNLYTLMVTNTGTIEG